MPHEMTQHDQMYSVREAPWHLGSGTNVLMLDAAPETRMVRSRRRTRLHRRGGRRPSENGAAGA